MKATFESIPETTVATRVAGEDIKPGQLVAVLSEVVEVPSFLWSCSTAPLAADEPVRLRMKPEVAGQPNRVVAVCLPFVYVETPKDDLVTFDVRRHELVRLCARNGLKAWNRLRGKRKSKKKKRR